MDASLTETRLLVAEEDNGQPAMDAIDNKEDTYGPLWKSMLYGRA